VGDYPSTLTLHSPVQLEVRFGERRVFVEERRHEGHVELRVSALDVRGGHKLAAAEALGLLEHELRSLGEILILGDTHTHTETDSGGGGYRASFTEITRPWQVKNTLTA